MKKLLLGLLCTKLFSAQLGNISSFEEKGNEFYISTSDGAITKIIFYRSDIFRIWVGPKGNFTDPAGDEETSIVVHKSKVFSVKGKSCPSCTLNSISWDINLANCIARLEKSIPMEFVLR